MQMKQLMVILGANKYFSISSAQNIVIFTIFQIVPLSIFQGLIKCAYWYVRG